MDLLRKLGPLAIASRLRRLTEWLYKDGARIYQEQSLDFEPRWFSLFNLLKESGKISVTQAAQTLGLTHPAINQIAGEMSKRGLLESFTDKKDKRKRILQLTPKGKKAFSSLEPVWKDFESAVSELLNEAGSDFLTIVGKLEDELKEKGMYERISRRIKERQLRKVSIIDYRPHFKKYFRSLNLEWLKEYFEVEKEDEELLSNPYEKIIKTGGFILFARLEGKIVGTTALIKHDEFTYELTKMAVTRKALGHQVGRKLALAAIEKAKNSGVGRIVLLTNPRLTAACNLYHSLGFVKLAGDQPWVIPYRRGGIPMSLDL
ncbi:MAG TPA: bifunctional helix-turn-helix transcriptional regulator/GNAT family N-acetyltransferase [Terriglobales bacterium]|nr:bifunctional helix-turn-helix transcriptional regulator/GNAT family N-acetyltransferase [Terriglobales bacterium]